jgi:pilus assembly protein Flp/PilA
MSGVSCDVFNIVWFVTKKKIGDNMVKRIKKFVSNESGVTAIEYALIAGLIALVIIAAVSLLGTNLSTVFSNVAASV